MSMKKANRKAETQQSHGTIQRRVQTGLGGRNFQKRQSSAQVLNTDQESGHIGGISDAANSYDRASTEPLDDPPEKADISVALLPSNSVSILAQPSTLPSASSSTLPPLLPPSSTPAPLPVATNRNLDQSNNTAVACVLGGFVGCVLILVGLAWYFFRRRNKPNTQNEVGLPQPAQPQANNPFSFATFPLQHKHREDEPPDRLEKEQDSQSTFSHGHLANSPTWCYPTAAMSVPRISSEAATVADHSEPHLSPVDPSFEFPDIWNFIRRSLRTIPEEREDEMSSRRTSAAVTRSSVFPRSTTPHSPLTPIGEHSNSLRVTDGDASIKGGNHLRMFAKPSPATGNLVQNLNSSKRSEVVELTKSGSLLLVHDKEKQRGNLLVKSSKSFPFLRPRSHHEPLYIETEAITDQEQRHLDKNKKDYPISSDCKDEKSDRSDCQSYILKPNSANRTYDELQNWDWPSFSVDGSRHGDHVQVEEQVQDRAAKVPFSIGTNSDQMEYLSGLHALSSSNCVLDFDPTDSMIPLYLDDQFLSNCGSKFSNESRASSDLGDHILSLSFTADSGEMVHTSQQSYRAANSTESNTEISERLGHPNLLHLDSNQTSWQRQGGNHLESRNSVLASIYEPLPFVLDLPDSSVDTRSRSFSDQGYISEERTIDDTTQDGRESW